jgi:hypothetical protein
MKNVVNDDNGLIYEYFNRQERRHSLWKSEAEYKHLTKLCVGKIKGVDNDKDFRQEIGGKIDSLIKYGDKYNSGIKDTILINKGLSDRIENDMKESESKGKKKELEDLNEMYNYCQKFKKFAESADLCFETGFVIIANTKFNSTFSKTADMAKILVWFKASKKARYLSEIMTTLESKDYDNAARTNDEKYFYIYTKKLDNKKKVQNKFFQFMKKDL